MKKILFLLLSVLFISCKHNVSKELSNSEIKSLIKKDTLYETLIPLISKIQDTVNKDILLKAKYSDITYEQCLKYVKTRDQEREKFIEKFKPEIDKKLNNLKNEFESFKKIMQIEFHSISVYFYNYIGGVEDAYFKFKITVTEPIDGGSFKYSIIDKTTGKEVESGGCKFSQKVKDSYIGVWEIPYGTKEEFGYQSNQEIKDRYIFNFTILSIYKDNQLLKNVLSNDLDLESDLYKTLLLKKYKINLFENDYIPFEDSPETDLYNLIVFLNDNYYKEWEQICKNIDSEVFEYFNIKIKE